MQTMTVNNGNLFDVASRVLGDATLWHAIAAASNITDPWLSGLTVLTIPDTEDISGTILVAG